MIKALGWMAQGTLSLLDNIHDIPKHIEKLLSNFVPEHNTKVEDHIDDFYMHLRMLEE